MKGFELWLAQTPAGSFVKIAVAAALGAIASWLVTAEVHPLVVAISAAVIPIAINYLNGEDLRYGRVSDDVWVDDDLV